MSLGDEWGESCEKQADSGEYDQKAHGNYENKFQSVH